MKTRYKIGIVIAVFAVFYVQLPLMYHICAESDDDCTALVNLMNWTRMGVFSNDHIEWSSTSDRIEENETFQDYLEINQSFILTMVVIPSAIIVLLVIMDKKKRYIGGMEDMRKRK